MKLRLLIIPVLMATALFAQGPGGFGGRRGQAGGTGTPPAPPTAEQLATREVNMISTVLRLTTAQSSALLAALAGASGPLTMEQTTLQGNAAALKAAWTTANSTIAGAGTPDLTTINGLNAANLAARATAAAAVLKAVSALSVTVTANQQTMLIRMLVNGGGGGPGFRR